MTFASELIMWYREHKRELPWRETRDAYQIWLSEIILQQTRVEQGLPYYFRFIERFETVGDLAQANEDEVLHLWQGLGYYSRGRNLHKAARMVKDVYGGVFPLAYTELLKLPGIGAYTAAAISSFANDEPRAVLDGNVFRVLARYYGVDTPINSSEGKAFFSELARENLDQKNPALYNQAIMDFGAIHCKPKLPLCSSCMLRLTCFAFLHNEVDRLPVKLKGKASRNRFFHYFILRDHDRILVSKRGSGDIWENLYEFPLIESEREIGLTELSQLPEFIQHFGENMQLTLLQAPKKHVLSHQNIYAAFYEIRLNNGLRKKKSNWNYVFIKDLNNLAKHKLIFSFLERSNF